MQNISIRRGTSLTISLQIFASEGVPYTYFDATKDKLLFGVKSNAENTEYDIFKDNTTITDGILDINQDSTDKSIFFIHLQPSDTAKLDFDRYWFDISLQKYYSENVNSFENIVECSQFNVLPSITHKE